MAEVSGHEVGSVDRDRLASRVDLFHEVGSVDRDKLASRVDLFMRWVVWIEIGWPPEWPYSVT